MPFTPPGPESVRIRKMVPRQIQPSTRRAQMPDHEGRTIHGRTITVQTGFSGGQMMFAVLGGAVLGAVAGLLLAPRSGAETRAFWRGLSDEARARMAGLPDALREASA